MHDLILYSTDDGKVTLQLRASDGSVGSAWTIAEPVVSGKQHIGLPIRSIPDQVKRPVQRYNLDLILAAGYRVPSPRGLPLRQWAGTRLRERLDHPARSPIALNSGSQTP